MNTMTPIQAQVLLHCYYACESYKENTLAVRDAYEILERHRLVELDVDSACYTATGRGRTLVEAMLTIPLPRQVWVIPDQAMGAPIECTRRRSPRSAGSSRPALREPVRTDRPPLAERIYRALEYIDKVASRGKENRFRDKIQDILLGKTDD